PGCRMMLQTGVRAILTGIGSTLRTETLTSVSVFACCDTAAQPCLATFDWCAISSIVGPEVPVIGWPGARGPCVGWVGYPVHSERPSAPLPRRHPAGNPATTSFTCHPD